MTVPPLHVCGAAARCSNVVLRAPTLPGERGVSLHARISYSKGHITLASFDAFRTRDGQRHASNAFDAYQVNIALQHTDIHQISHMCQFFLTLF